MFQPFSGPMNLVAQRRVAPEDIPPPTPVAIPRYQPFAQDDEPVDPQEALSSLLKSTGRSTASLGPLGLSAIGLDLKLDAEATDLIPDPSYIPDFDKWSRLTPDEARDKNEASRRPLRNGNLSPGCQIYLERHRELSNTNYDAFRTVRRIPPPKGKRQARLGNAYEFFRCLELFTTYWDDPTEGPTLPPSPEMSAAERQAPPKVAENVMDGPDGAQNSIHQNVVRTAEGSAMPPEFRLYLAAAFIKFVSYDFGCNVSMPRLEPRLQLSSSRDHSGSRKSYTASNCHFIFQSPTTREAARAGLVHGPLGAVSARPIVDFTTPDVETAQSLDLAREVVAALITAQHRAREGKTERRFGDGSWWASKPRWGGGAGGPIGREIDRDNNTLQAGKKNAKDAPPAPAPSPAPTGKLKESQNSHRAGALPKMAKRSKKAASIYENYRMVRPPACTWDQKVKYETIGKRKGAKFDDVFVVTSLFHHVSILRLRVPDRLLEVLDGSPDPDVTRRSWGKVQGWRSPWYDLFETEQRLAAMRLVWAMMAYQMRAEAADEDVQMTGS